MSDTVIVALIVLIGSVSGSLLKPLVDEAARWLAARREKTQRREGLLIELRDAMADAVGSTYSSGLEAWEKTNRDEIRLGGIAARINDAELRQRVNELQSAIHDALDPDALEISEQQHANIRLAHDLAVARLGELLRS